jgi:hypothetical protein
LFGACFQRGFEVNFNQLAPAPEELDAFAAALVKTLYDALRPAS